MAFVDPFVISIQGSCATRDICKLLEKQISVSYYRARSSIVSLLSPPIEPWYETYSPAGVDKPFELRNVVSDFAKDWLNDPQPPEVPMVYDFIDERFGVLELGNGGYVTMSTVLQKLANTGRGIPLKMRGRRISPPEQEFGALIEWNLDRFCEVLRDRGPLLVNACYWANLDDRGNKLETHPQDMVESMNRLLDRIYDRLSRSTSAQFFGLPRHRYVSATQHRWALAPFHWSMETEAELASEMFKAVSRTCPLPTR